MLIMYHVHHLSTEMVGKTPTKVPKSTPNILTKLLLYFTYKMSNIRGKRIQFSAIAKEGHLHNITETEKEAMGLHVICYLVTREFT